MLSMLSMLELGHKRLLPRGKRKGEKGKEGEEEGEGKGERKGRKKQKGGKI